MIDLRKLAEPGSIEETLLEKIDLKRLPRHIAVIMDGNGRWARARSLPRVEGHRAGIASRREIRDTEAMPARWHRLGARDRRDRGTAGAPRHHPLRLLRRELEAAPLR